MPSQDILLLKQKVTNTEKDYHLFDFSSCRMPATDQCCIPGMQH